jgi:hypothetical protein
METENSDSEVIKEQNSTVSADSQDDEIESNWLNEVLTKDTA